MSGHRARERRSNTGHTRWSADCPDCSWRWIGMGGKEQAATAAANHNHLTAALAVIAGMPCHCWHDAEFDVGCVKHHLLTELEGIAA